MAKPDNRADNVEKIQDAVQNTIENYREAEDYLADNADDISSEEAANIRNKNENREQSIQGMREEIKDEAQAQNEQ